MRTRFQVFGLSLIMILGCNPYEDSPERKQWLAEIKTVEQEFNAMARDSGLARAFGYYATDNAVLQREERFIKGRDSIIAYYERNSSPDMNLNWEPSYVDVSDDGTLGYTYGKFKFTMIDTTGSERTQSGVFHTVWKRQDDGTWRYVWD
ncbi:MAG: nuclear transport factor 2 family protein [Flavobacteriaceae bacterium]|nr:nuclear transport factor 2 family protein [Bacteroidia bacterium]NNK70228.1 nuclear transport factor 2 family protein [Flavobacteriaceae bacterium]